MAETVLEVDSVDTALAIFGNCDENIRLLEQAFGVTAICRGTEVKLTGGEEDVERARRALDAMLMLRAGGTPLEEQTVRYCISLAGSGDEARVKDLTGDFIAITAKCRDLRRGAGRHGQDVSGRSHGREGLQGTGGEPHYSHAARCGSR